jgi:tetratricopeptide (TPR) repeat protein
MLFNAVPPKAVSETTNTKGPTEKAEQKTDLPNRKDQAYKIFEEILVLTETSDIKDAFPKIESLYFKIIHEYPDIALAQECHWRLVILYVEKSSPPLFEKAENTYAEFLKKYPQSVIKHFIEDTLSKSYYKKGKWKKLLELNLPAAEEYYKTGKLSNPAPLFMYAEAQFNLGDIGAAEKAYKSLVDSFPKSRITSSAKKRLEEIKKKAPQN